MPITVHQNAARHRRGGHRPPAGQRPRRGRVVRPGRRRPGRRAGARQPGGDPPGRGPGLLRRRRHQGDPGPGRRGPDRCQPGLLRRLRRRLRVRGPGHRRRPRVLPGRRGRASPATPTSWWPPTTPPSGCPRWTEGPSVRPPICRGWSRSTGCGRWSTPPSRPPPPSCTTTARCSGWCPATSWSARPTRWPTAIAAKSPPSPPGQGVAQRDRPGRRQGQLPARAGVHLRAPRRRRGRRAAGRLRREARRRHHQIGGSVADKRLTLDELIGELRSGMTIGIGGWGSRRKPMAAVRAILRIGPHRPHRGVLRWPRRRPPVRGRARWPRWSTAS